MYKYIPCIFFPENFSSYIMFEIFFIALSRLEFAVRGHFEEEKNSNS